MAFCHGVAHNSPDSGWDDQSFGLFARNGSGGWSLPSGSAGGEGGRAMGALSRRARRAGNQSRTWSRPLWVAMTSMALAIGAGDPAHAAKVRGQRQVASIETRDAGEPLMAVVSLRSQQITVYDADGWILRGPVSSGQKGRETPAGVFSVIQKQAEHYSNLYDDAFMPHMQRLTWSGIALHGGIVPAHPASHGCVRMPYDFAERLFEVTKLGMRVIVAPNDVAPVSIAHPSLLQPKPEAEAAAAVRAAEAQEAAGRAEQARLAALAAPRELAQTRLPVRATRNLKLRAEAQLAAAERAVDSAASAEAKEQAEQAKAEAATRVAE